jgi:tetratricopeptide (TPR) repeat protein
MNPNLTPEQLRAQADMIGGMSDEQLRSATAQASAFNPMMAGMNPDMMRQASQMMKNMSPEQLASMNQMAQNMMRTGQMPNMPGGFPGGMPASSPTSGQPQKTANLNADQKSDLTKAEQLKGEAGKLFSAKKYDEACELYFSAINTIRANTSLRNEKPARECEIACRSNLALCKLNLKQYDQVLDHCEQVLGFICFIQRKGK